MVGLIGSGALPQNPASRAFEPSQAPSNPYKIKQTQNVALKPEKIVPVQNNPALSQNQTGINSASELSKLNIRGQTLDVSA